MKKKIVASRLLVLAMITQVTVADTMLDKSKLDELKSMSKALQDPAITIKDAIDKDSVYLLKVEVKSPNGSQNIPVYLDKKTHAIYIGTGYDKDGEMILLPKEASVIKDGVSFTKGSGKEEIYIVTDPECPYCVRFEKALGDKLSNYTVHTILFPLSFHKKAPIMVEWIMQGKDDDEKHSRYRKILIDGSKEYEALNKDTNQTFKNSPQIEQLIEKANKATVELGAQGTPMIFDSSFNRMEPSQLKITTPRAVK